MSQANEPSAASWRPPLRSFLIGGLACIALYAVMKAVTVFELPAGRYGKLGISLTTFLVAGFLIGRMIRRGRSAHPWRVAATGFGAALIGVAVGVIFWNNLEDLVFSRFGDFPIYQERRLFPIDVALLWTFGSLPILAGIVAGVTIGGVAPRDPSPTS